MILTKSKLSFSSINDDYTSRNVQESALQILSNLDPDYYVSYEDSLSFVPPGELTLIKNGAKAKKITDLKTKSPSCALMSDENILAIYAYTFDFGEDKKESNVYRKVNLVLSERRLNEFYSIRDYVLHLFSALFKLGDKLKVEGATLYRGIDGKKRFNFAGHMPGICRSWPGFTSTSTNKETVVEEFLDSVETPILFEIVGAKGYRINFFSAHDNEEGKYI